MFHHLGRHLGGKASPLVIFVDDHEARRLFNRRQQSVAVERLETARVDDLDLDLAFQLLRDGQAIVDLQPARQHGDVAPLALHVGQSQRHQVFLGGHVPFERDGSDVPQEEDGIVVAYGRLHQPLGVIRGRRHAHLDAGMMDERAVWESGVLVGHPAAEAAGTHHRHRHWESAAVHEMEMARLQKDFRSAVIGESGIHKIDDGPHPLQRRAEGTADHAGFGQGSVDDARRAEFLAQARSVRECPRLDADAQQVDIVVALHFFAIGFLDRLEE